MVFTNNGVIFGLLLVKPIYLIQRIKKNMKLNSYLCTYIKVKMYMKSISSISYKSVTCLTKSFFLVVFYLMVEKVLT